MADPFTARRTALHARLIEALVRAFLGLPDWRDPAPFVAVAVPILRGAQTAMVGLTDAAIAAMLTRALRTPVAPAALDPAPIIDAVRSEVTPEQAYRRPFDDLWTALHEDRPLTEAVELGTVRLREIAETDLQITYSHAARAALTRSPAADKVTGWRRVLRRSESCALCVIASTQRYHVGDLNPVHPGCDCEVEPITSADRHVIDRALLDAASKAAEDFTGSYPTREQLRDVLLSITREHGEHGPVLVDPRHRFTGPGDPPTA
ncbi:hypothetical protein [Catellatospora sp. NPDC049609]|uniref:hypothetical protein n=1 Tax=Catellatospora sp. NPDC049609 TaxID=3155505 RepID=UPI00342CDF08